jgi:predicted ATPase/transcriptional regulator with XRE-family HTH domain
MVHRDTHHFGSRLRQHRQAAGLTQEELAERSGVSVKAISALERGHRRRPYPNTVRALARALDLTDEERSALATLASHRETVVADTGTFQPVLPSAPAALIGRSHELREITGLLRSGQVRLLTVTGAGGVGKTRLALAAGEDLAGDVDGRVAFVPLAPLSDPALVLPTIAQTLGLSEAGDIAVQQLLVECLRDNAWLLVLDNVEHVLDASSDVAELLAACPRLMIIATSRAPLRVRAEHEYPLRPLALPEMSYIPSLDEVAGASSVQLFLERARTAVPDFDLTQTNYVAVAAICRRLDGLPLALELVAARMRFLSPAELLARLDHVLPLLVGGSRDLPQRQQTMQAAIGWSYDLLHQQERALFRRLSIFAGGWTLEAAEAVTAWDEVSREKVLSLLASLVEQSLAVVETDQNGSTRYRMLEPVRQFAAERVEPYEAIQLSDQHLAWNLALAQRGAQELRGPHQQLWLDRLEHEHDNLRTALGWAQHEPGRNQAGLQLATALWRFWETRGYLTEARRWLAHALAANEDAPATLRAEGLNAAGNLARDQGDHVQAVAFYEESLALCREIGNVYGMARALNNLGNTMQDEARYREATLSYYEALAMFRTLGQEWDIANALNNLGIALGFCGDYDQATRLLEEAIALRERIGDTSYRARSLDALGVVMQKQGKLDRAASLHEESLALRRQLGDSRGIAISLNNLGQVARYRGDYSKANLLLEESLLLRRLVGDKHGIVATLRSLADVARHRGNHVRALDLYQGSLAQRQQTGVSEGVVDTLFGVAAVAAAGGDAIRAARLLGASDALREALGQRVPAVDHADYDSTGELIRTSLSPDDYARSLAEGRSMTPQEAIADALAGSTNRAHLNL